jgi:hypothetical protein
MKNKDLFNLNPVEKNLINDGVVEINTSRENAQGLQILRHELKTFICEGEYQRGLFRILDTYLRNFEESKQPAVWVSGFFGSGKSHLVKMLGYLWEDFKFPTGETARTIKKLPADVNDLLVELDHKQKIVGRLSVTGTLKDFPSADIRYSFLQLFLNALGLPPQFHHFKFIYWAKQEGIFDELKAIIEAQGKKLQSEYENMFVSSILAKAVLQVKPEFAENEAKVKENFKANFQRVDSISRDQMISTIKNEILPMFFGTKIPATIIILDEVQQFIGSNQDKSIDVQNLAQDICSSFEGKFLLIGTGQQSLSETSLLQRLKDRFTVNVLLSDTDVETVTRKTILFKKPSAISEVEKKLDGALGEISRNLSGTDFGYRTDDNAMLSADYPILPSTRKFWKKVLQVIDTAGTSGQLRSQLRIVDDSLKYVAERDLGCIVPADFIFDQKRPQLLQNALLLNETNNLIESRKPKGVDGVLEARILSAVFLIDQVPDDLPGGKVKSDANTIADLLIDNLNQSSDHFRNKIKELIQSLVDEKLLMPIKDEFKLQTKIGTEWEQEFTAQVVKLNNNGDDQVNGMRKEKITAFVREQTKTINILQGVSRQKRDFEIWDKSARPTIENKLNLWVRNGWDENRTNFMDEVRGEGSEGTLAYLFVSKLSDQELRSEIIKFLAADLTLQTKGLPGTPEGEQAKKSMETRKSNAKETIGELIEKICQEATVYLAGGNSVESGSIRDNIESALISLADRQFREFKKADFKDWDKALSGAIAGNPDALKKTGWDRDLKDHPVAVDILRFLGNTGKLGRDIRNNYIKTPYGWSQDAIDAVIILLKNTEHISTPEPALNQSKIGGASFKKELHTLTVPDKLKLRKLYQDAGISCKPGEEFLHSNSFLEKFKELADKISGDAPRPEPFNLSFIRDIENLDGNERLLNILENQNDLKDRLSEWNRKSKTAGERIPAWRLLAELANLAPSSGDLEVLVAEIDSIRENRLLLQEPDPIHPKLEELAGKMKQVLDKLKQQFITIYDDKMKELRTNAYFAKLTPEQADTILVSHQLLSKPEIKPLDAAGLLNQLQKASFYTWETKIAALPGQFQSALEEAIKMLEPKAQTYVLPKRTISNQKEVDEYISEVKTRLEDLLKNASSIILK